jgi:hypothetical protein
VKINLRASSAGPITKTINLGRISTPPKTRTVPLAISLNSIYQKIKFKKLNTSQDNNLLCQDLSPNIKGQEEMVEKLPPHYKKLKTIKSLYQNQEPS